MDQQNTTRKPKTAVAAVLATVQSLEAQLTALRAQVEQLAEAPASDLLDSKQTLAEYSIGVDGLKAANERGELHLVRGARGKILIERSEIERWIKSRPVAPRPRRAKPAEDLSEWEDRADNVLHLAGGSRRG